MLRRVSNGFIVRESLLGRCVAANRAIALGETILDISPFRAEPPVRLHAWLMIRSDWEATASIQGGYLSRRLSMFLGADGQDGQRN